MWAVIGSLLMVALIAALVTALVLAAVARLLFYGLPWRRRESIERHEFRRAGDMEPGG